MQSFVQSGSNDSSTNAKYIFSVNTVASMEICIDERLVLWLLMVIPTVDPFQDAIPTRAVSGKEYLSVPRGMDVQKAA